MVKTFARRIFWNQKGQISKLYIWFLIFFKWEFWKVKKCHCSDNHQSGIQNVHCIVHTYCIILRVHLLVIVNMLLLPRDEYISRVSKLGTSPGLETFKKPMPINKTIDDEALSRSTLDAHRSHVTHQSSLLIKHRVLKQGKIKMYL